MLKFGLEIFFILENSLFNYTGDQRMKHPTLRPPIPKESVTKLLKGLDPSKALGPDELHPRVLKELATELGPVFAHLFSQSV